MKRTPRENAGTLLGGVERPRRMVRFARLIHRRGRDFGGPAVRAASGGSPSLPACYSGWYDLGRSRCVLPPQLLTLDTGLLAVCDRACLKCRIDPS
jgi:hypothetical protein